MPDENKVVRSIHFHPDDLEIASVIAEQSNVTRAEVLRWALRWYAINGPWRDNDNKHTLAKIADLVIGKSVGPNIARKEHCGNGTKKEVRK